MSDLPTDPRSFHVEADAAPGAAQEEMPALPLDPPPRRRGRWPWILAAVLLVVAFAAGAFGATAWSTWSAVEKVDLDSVLQGSDGGTNYLIVGTDSREGVSADTANAGVIFGEGVSGERTDTIAILRIDGDTARLLAIPRDLYVSIDGGSPNRINAAFAFGGPPALINTIQSELGIGIDHYLEIDLAGFLGLVDALGGVTIHFPHPAYDLKSGLRIDTAGPMRLDGSEALAYVRSRHLVEIIDGVEVRDLTSDLGRVQRQQSFLAAVFAELGSTWNPFTLLGALDGVSGNVRVDSSLSLRGAATLGLDVRGAEPLTATVPTSRHITDSGADVLLMTAEAEVLFAEFRG